MKDFIVCPACGKSSQYAKDVHLYDFLGRDVGPARLYRCTRCPVNTYLTEDANDE